MRRLGPVVIERAVAPSGPWVLTVSAGAVAAALAATVVMFWAFGLSPARVYGAIVTGTVADPRAAPEILRQMTPLLLCGAGLVVAFRAQFWNIGAEGQLLAGAVGATGVALFLPAGPWAIPLLFAASFAAGALWGVLPAWLRLRLEVNEVITTLMMNYIALFLVEWLIHGPWKGRDVFGFAYTDTFPEAAWLPVLPGTHVHWPTLLLGLLAAGGLALLLARTGLGFEIRVLGQNPHAARYAGIDPVRTSLAAMVLSAGLAGLAGAGEVAGIHHKLLSPMQVSSGYGYAAIIVAWLARGSPLAAVLTALFLGWIFTGGDVMKVSLQLPFQVTLMFNGLILFFLIGSERLLGYRMRWSPARGGGVPVLATAPDDGVPRGGTPGGAPRA
ncbi:MAG: ABC transporter permease [Armatimonadota bacterium]|nr:ABC transporter permease [Armatimonadota bacterium]